METGNNRQSTVFLKVTLIGIAFVFILAHLKSQAISFSPEKASFAVKFKDEISSYRTMSVFVLPEELVTFEVLSSAPGDGYLLESSTGSSSKLSHKKWRWEAPQETGIYPVRIVNEESGETVTLNVLVMVPYRYLQGEYLNGYRIGSYSSVPFKRLSIYKPPPGFIEVTKENEDILLSPHFRLKQFLCKQEGDYPKYVVIKEILLLKLELILEKMNEKGYHCETFHIMSGYRTPYYNQAIGNVKYSRHLYGDAADIFIDQSPQDEVMDDLNKDGKIDHQDAEVIHEIIDQMYGKPWYTLFLGGLAAYAETQSHGPFVHVDTRGFHARWGD